MKKTRKTVSCLLAVVLLLAVLPVMAENECVSALDMFGRVITLSKPAERVVVLTAGECEIICALGAYDKIIARGEYCDHPAEIADVTMVQSGYNTNVEEILALNPDLVITNGMDQTKEIIDTLEIAGLKVLESVSSDFEGVYTSIRNIGTLLGKDAEAEALVSSMQSRFEAVSADAEKFAGKTVYFEVSPLEWGLWTAGKGTFMDEVCSLLGLTNAFADLDGWAEISEEQVLERNPDYIVTITMYFGEGPTPEEEILSRPGWTNVSAVKSGAILNLWDNELSRPSQRLCDGAEMLHDFVLAH